MTNQPTQHADCVPHEGPGAVLWHEEQAAARPAEDVRPAASRCLPNCQCRRHTWMADRRTTKSLLDGPIWTEDDVVRLFGEWEATRSRGRLRRLKKAIEDVLNGLETP